MHKTQSDLEKLLREQKLPPASRERLAEDNRQLTRIIEKLSQKQFHIAVFGRVSVGKSSLLNALMGQAHFETSVLHGQTKETADIVWQTYHDQSLYFIDTPGIDEFQGEMREAIARQAIALSDMILFVIDGDLTQIEFDALRYAKSLVKSLIIVVNKADRLSLEERAVLNASILEKIAHLGGDIPVCFVAADPREKEIIKIDANGHETVMHIKPETHIEALKSQIWQAIKADGHALQVLSSALFAGNISQQIGQEVVMIRRDVANTLIKKYAIGKAIAIGINPVPVADVSVLLADVAMIRHLAEIYGFSLTRREAGQLMGSIVAELGLVLGSSYGIAAIASLLKGLSAGLSTVLTAGAQGLSAYYGTYLVGKACEAYFSRGATWGEDGIGYVLETLLADIDKKAVLQEAKSDIERILKGERKTDIT